MDRRTLIRGGIALTGGLAMPDTTINLSDVSPDDLAARVEAVRAAYWEGGQGAAVLTDADALGGEMIDAFHLARDARAPALATRLALVLGEHAQNLSLMYLKAGTDRPALWWGEQAETCGEVTGDADLTALGACRRSVVHKTHPEHALDILRRVRDTDMSPWARVMVELHMATAHAAASGGEAIACAEWCFDRAGQALDRADGPRPRWAGSLHHSWIESYHQGKAMVGHRPADAEELLSDALAATPTANHTDRGAVQLRRADAAVGLDRLDDAAALGLSAYHELHMAGAGRDLARLRRLSQRLAATDSPVARELADAVEV